MGQSYAVGDAVSFGGASYIALAANVGKEPDSGSGAVGCAGAGEALRGLPEAVGPAGPQGPAGAAGSEL